MSPPTPNPGPWSKAGVPFKACFFLILIPGTLHPSWEGLSGQGPENDWGGGQRARSHADPEPIPTPTPILSSGKAGQLAKGLGVRVGGERSQWSQMARQWIEAALLSS